MALKMCISFVKSRIKMVEDFGLLKNVKTSRRRVSKKEPHKSI